MQTTSGIQFIRDQVKDWRLNQQSVAFVPTMGNLHDGHLQLVQRAKQLADRVVVSIFVNPMQFEPGADYEKYPRTLASDQQKLFNMEVDLLFAPEETLIQSTRVEVPELSDILCGEFRPGHFVGVTTIVCKLFNIVMPDLAVFGEKDYQQLLLIRKMVMDLNLPIKIVGEPIVREENGLAMSSRNGYLSTSEFMLAGQIYAQLSLVAQALKHASDYRSLLQAAICKLESQKFVVEYLTLRCAKTLAKVDVLQGEMVLLIAVRLGKTRLIDNIQLNI